MSRARLARTARCTSDEQQVVALLGAERLRGQPSTAEVPEARPGRAAPRLAGRQRAAAHALLHPGEEGVEAALVGGAQRPQRGAARPRLAAQRLLAGRWRPRGRRSTRMSSGKLAAQPAGRLAALDALEDEILGALRAA